MASVNPASFTHIGVIQEKSPTYTTGQKDSDWIAKYSNVKSKRLPPLRGSEELDERQYINIQKDSWLIMASGRVLDADMCYVVSGVRHYIDSVREYKGDQRYKVLDTHVTDNEPNTSLVALTDLTVTNADQSLSPGAALTTITITADQDAVITATDLPTTCTLTKVSDTVATITGTAPASTAQFTVTARGVGGGGPISKTIDITVSAATPVTGLSYDNNTQTIWAGSGSVGVYIPQNPTTTPSDATGVYSSSDLPAGFSLDANTGIVSVSDFDLVPTGANTPTIRFTGSGSFSGFVEYQITITKKELWRPDDLNSGLEAWWNFTESGSVTLGTYESASVFDQVNDLSGNDYHLMQASGASKPIVGSVNGKRVAIHFGSSFMSFTPNSDIEQEFTFFYGAIIPPQSGNAYLLGGELDVNNRRAWFECQNFFYYQSWGVQSFSNITADQINKSLSVSGGVFQMNFNGASSSIKIDDGESLSLGPFNCGTNNIPSSNPTRLLQYGSGATNGSGAVLMHSILVSGSISSNDEDKIQGFIAWEMGTQSKLPSGHTYEILPPFKDQD